MASFNVIPVAITSVLSFMLASQLPYYLYIYIIYMSGVHEKSSGHLWLCIHIYIERERERF